VVFADATVVFSESYIQAPVQVVFDTPVFSDGLGEGRGLVFEAGDELGGFSSGAAMGPVLGTAQGFTIDGDGFPLKRGGKLSGPTGEEVMESLGIELGEETAEGVVGGDAVGQFQEFLQPVKLGPAVFSHLGQESAPLVRAQRAIRGISSDRTI
jgi:hypothetical protein